MQEPEAEPLRAATDARQAHTDAELLLVAIREYTESVTEMVSKSDLADAVAETKKDNKIKTTKVMLLLSIVAVLVLVVGALAGVAFWQAKTNNDQARQFHKTGIQIKKELDGVDSLVAYVKSLSSPAAVKARADQTAAVVVVIKCTVKADIDAALAAFVAQNQKLGLTYKTVEVRCA